jgi:heavy metal sensor kinase
VRVTEAPARWPSSLRARLTLWYTVVLGVPLVVFAVICYFVFAHALFDRTDRFIGDALTVFAREVGAERRTRSTAEDAIRTTVSEVRFRNLRIVVRDPAGRVVAMGVESDANRARDGDRILASLLTRPKAPASDETWTVPGPLGGDRVVMRSLAVAGVPFQLTGSYPLAEVSDVLDRVRTMFLVAIPLLVAAAAIGAHFLASRGLAPVAAMAQRAGEISASNLDERLPVAGGDELTGLARVINALLDRLEGAFAQQQRFMADASHELRTPTAIVRTEAEVTLARANRSETEYRESVAVMLGAAQRLTRIVDGLFLLARADAGHLVLRAEPVYLEELVHDAVRAMEQVGERHGVRVELTQMTQAPFHGDADLLGRLLLNLLDNAIKYSPPGAMVEVEMRAEPGLHVISVIDAGPGIAPEAVESIFDRFYRGNAARSRADDSVTDGAGLGLAIARRIAVAHGGRLEVASSRPGRTEFRLTLPAAEAAEAAEA